MDENTPTSSVPVLSYCASPVSPPLNFKMALLWYVGALSVSFVPRFFHDVDPGDDEAATTRWLLMAVTMSLASSLVGFVLAWLLFRRRIRSIPRRQCLVLVAFAGMLANVWLVLPENWDFEFVPSVVLKYMPRYFNPNVAFYAYVEWGVMVLVSYSILRARSPYTGVRI